MVISDFHVALANGHFSVIILLDFSHSYIHSLFFEILSSLGPGTLLYLALYLIVSQFSLLDPGSLKYPKFRPRMSGQT